MVLSRRYRISRARSGLRRPPKKSLIQVLTAIAAIDVRIQNHATGLTVLDVRRRRLVEAKLASERREMAVREQKEMEGIYRAPPNQGA